MKSNARHMKTVLTFCLLSLSSSLCAASSNEIVDSTQMSQKCFFDWFRGPQGEPGPQGPQGDPGAFSSSLTAYNAADAFYTSGSSIGDPITFSSGSFTGGFGPIGDDNATFTFPSAGKYLVSVNVAKVSQPAWNDPLDVYIALDFGPGVYYDNILTISADSFVLSGDSGDIGNFVSQPVSMSQVVDVSSDCLDMVVRLRSNTSMNILSIPATSSIGFAQNVPNRYISIVSLD